MLSIWCCGWRFHPFDFYFPQGCSAIIGRNGIGRSVLPRLLLYEPDNHLELESKQALAKAVAHYQSVLILVSHDDYFVAAAQVEKCWKLE